MCSFKFSEKNTTDYNLTIGFPSGASPCTNSIIGPSGIVYDGIGAEAQLTSCIDPASAGLVEYPVRQSLQTAADIVPPVNAIGNLVSNDTTSTGITISVTGTVTVLPINAKYPLWTLLRSGQFTGNFTDTPDLGSNFLAALAPSTATGSVYHARVCNGTMGMPGTIHPMETLSVNGTDTTLVLSGTTIVAQGSCLPLTLTIVTGGTVDVVGG